MLKKFIALGLLTTCVSLVCMAVNVIDENTLNGSFETWTGTYPDNWTFWDASSAGVEQPGTTNATVAKETSDVHHGANALSVTFGAYDLTYRYTMRSEAFVALPATSYSIKFWGKGGSARVYWARSTELLGDTAWTMWPTGASANSTEWTEATSSTTDLSTQSTYLRWAVATHCLSGTNLFDRVIVGTPAGISDWDLH